MIAAGNLLNKNNMAERQGFEPWDGLHHQRFSRPPHSTALAPLRILFSIECFSINIKLFCSFVLSDVSEKLMQNSGALFFHYSRHYLRHVI